VIHNAEPPNVERQRDAFKGVAQVPMLHASSSVVSIQWSRANVDGDIGNSSPLVLVLVRRESRRVSVGVAKTMRAPRSPRRRPVRLA
jgi:hypothetical protein